MSRTENQEQSEEKRERGTRGMRGNEIEAREREKGDGEVRKMTLGENGKRKQQKEQECELMSNWFITYIVKILREHVWFDYSLYICTIIYYSVIHVNICLVCLIYLCRIYITHLSLEALEQRGNLFP